MGPLKPVIGLIRTLVSIIYCGGLLYYFLDTAGSLEAAKSIGMGPFLIGLAAVGLIFCIVLVIKLVLVFAALRSSGGRSGTPPHDGDDGFDADALVARYMAQQSAEGRSNAPPVAKGGGAGRRSSFGRRTG